MKVKGVPVVMYHGVGPDKPGWPWNYLIVPADVFEGQMRILRDRGWNTITLRALYDHMAEGAPLPEKPVVLTFDDGYLDNWVFAYPLLEKYGHHAVVYMTTDFIDPRELVRPTLDDALRGGISREDLPVTGFLSWGEMRKLEESGVIEIQSHAKTHTWHYSGPEVVDFHRPRGVDGYVPPLWLGWNMYPDRKFEYMDERLEEKVPCGTPIYRHHKALAAKRYYEDQSVGARLVRHVSENGGESFFERKGWRGELMALVRNDPPASDRIETEQEYESRVMDELTGSKRILENGLGKRIEFLCWPGGGRNSRVLELAGQAGYLATTTHFYDRRRRNVFGQDPREINRTSCCSPWKLRGAMIRHTDPGYFLANLEDFAGIGSAIWRMRLFKAKYFFRYLLSGAD